MPTVRHDPSIALVATLLLAVAAVVDAEPVDGSGLAGRINVLLITADDLNWDSTGVTGCPLPGITPHIDRLASEGVRFERAFVTTSLCQPSRATMLTGLYPHRSGAVAFTPIDRDVVTLPEHLRAAGYFNGILGKVNHLTPENRFCWDFVAEAKDVGRDPKRYHQQMARCLDQAQEAGKPFFIMANSHAPHRPYPPAIRKPSSPPAGDTADRSYSPDEVPVPPFLPDLPTIREELAGYYTAVRRCDQIVGAILDALDEAGLRDNTLIMFLSDNGMPFPFAKASCYPNGTRTPWIVSWRGRIRAGLVDREHFISTIDLTPTVLEVLKLQPMTDLDGHSFLPLLLGQPQRNRDAVFTTFERVNERITGPMRSVTAGRYTYIYNAWYGRDEPLGNGASEGQTLAAMQGAARQDVRIAERVRMALWREPDELYDVEADPHALNNLIGDPTRGRLIQRLRQRLLQFMEETGDPRVDQYRDFLTAATE